MAILVSLAVLLAMIVMGALIIRALNERHDQRISAFRYGDLLPYRRRRTVAVPEGSAVDSSDSLARTVHEEPQGDSRRRPHTTRSTAAGAQRPARLLASPRRVTVTGRPPPEGRTARTAPAWPALAEVRVIAASPEAAREVVDALRQHFAGTEQRSCPASPQGGTTRLHLTVDTTRAPRAVQSLPSGEDTGHANPASDAHAAEIPPRVAASSRDAGDAAAEALKRADTARARRADWPPAIAWG
ncbi:hypothetical protein [Streptomyces sp. MI02-7b]|uniref:hypothetical protein n=1 Tax=Streptomyces sp. MI02-7b TaxID=462941 RepID=UPI0029B41B41|nr:hypothetical protein [Streptomyces sp. MI02-7b]MDX3077485.1 hypothetical protein [Streptomyces sp. MI02-7b]